MRDSRGFTLIELLIVIGMVAILAAIAVPNMTEFVRKNRINNQTRRIYNDLMNARMMAANTNRTHFVTFGLPGNQYQVIEDTNGNNTNDGGAGDTVRLARTVVPFTYSNTVPGNEAISTSAANNRIVFDSRGLATTTGMIWIVSTVQPAANCVVVTPTHVRIGRYDITGAINENTCR